MRKEPLVILLAEDDDGHATLVRRTLNRAGVTNQVVHVKHGQAALDYVRCHGDYAGRRTSGPLLMLLDINMPGMSGEEVLHRIKPQSPVPVIMLTTSADPMEIERCYAMGCNAYVTKPVEYDRFVETIRRLGLFLEVATVPLASKSRMATT